MGSDGSYITPPQASPASILVSGPMEDDDPEDLYGSQEVAGESEDRPPLEVVDLTAETEVPTDRVEDEPVSGILSKFLSFIPISLLSLLFLNVLNDFRPSTKTRNMYIGFFYYH